MAAGEFSDKRKAMEGRALVIVKSPRTPLLLEGGTPFWSDLNGAILHERTGEVSGKLLIEDAHADPMGAITTLRGVRGENLKYGLSARAEAMGFSVVRFDR